MSAAFIAMRHSQALNFDSPRNALPEMAEGRQKRLLHDVQRIVDADETAGQSIDAPGHRSASVSNASWFPRAARSANTSSLASPGTGVADMRVESQRAQATSLIDAFTLAATSGVTRR